MEGILGSFSKSGLFS